VVEFNCPSCGAPHEIRNPGIVKATCEYCGNAVIWDEQRIQDAGKQATLPEGFTRLYRGASGRLLSKRFEVIGRVRYGFGGGFWDEWFVTLQDGRTGWLSEDNHELALQSPLSDARVLPFAQYRPGTQIFVDKTEYLVQEIGEASCLGIEGELPKLVEAGESYPYVDASSPDGRYALGIEYDDDPPTVFHGRWLKQASVKLDDEGRSW